MDPLLSPVLAIFYVTYFDKDTLERTHFKTLILEMLCMTFYNFKLINSQLSYLK